MGQGLAVGFGLIIAIGMQNSFVLKQGILKNHVLVIALICSLIDSLLIVIGVNGFGAILAEHPLTLEFFNWGGVLFLFGYGLRSFYAAFKTQNLQVDNKPQLLSLKQAILMILVVSFLNPHNYLDSCVLIGSLSTHFSTDLRPSFALGAITASFIWFFTLSYSARLLRGVFENPLAWKILDFIIGCTMFTIAISLIYSIK